MSRAPKTLRSAILAIAAFSGLFGAHALDYLILIRDPHRREGILHASGHGYLPQIESIALGCLIAAVFGAFAWGFRSSNHLGRRGVARDAFALALAQSLGFTGLELGERLFSSGSLHGLTPAVLIVGIGLQVLVGVAAAFALRLLARAGATIARAAGAWAPRSPRPALLPAPVTFASPHRFLPRHDRPLRGPPALLFA